MNKVQMCYFNSACGSIEAAIMCGALDLCKELKIGAFKETVAEPVKIELYYEALCPDCQVFMRDQLFPTFQKLYDTGIFDIVLYPYGNANEREIGDDKWVFECQHGEQECQMNLVETCALHLLSHPRQFMPYIHCVENKPSLENAQKCAEDLDIEWAPISSCYNGSEGNFLEHQMAQKTDALQPKHTYVPWLVIDGVHTEKMQEQAQNNLAGFICKQYKGEKPEECNSYLIEMKRCYKTMVF